MTDCFRWYIYRTLEGDKIVGLKESEVEEYEEENDCKLSLCEGPWHKIGIDDL